MIFVTFFLYNSAIHHHMQLQHPFHTPTHSINCIPLQADLKMYNAAAAVYGGAISVGSSGVHACLMFRMGYYWRYRHGWKSSSILPYSSAISAMPSPPMLNMSSQYSSVAASESSSFKSLNARLYNGWMNISNQYMNHKSQHRRQ